MHSLPLCHTKGTSIYFQAHSGGEHSIDWTLEQRLIDRPQQCSLYVVFMLSSSVCLWWWLTSSTKRVNIGEFETKAAGVHKRGRWSAPDWKHLFQGWMQVTSHVAASIHNSLGLVIIYVPLWLPYRAVTSTSPSHGVLSVFWSFQP